MGDVRAGASCEAVLYYSSNSADRYVADTNLCIRFGGGARGVKMVYGEREDDSERRARLYDFSCASYAHCLAAQRLPALSPRPSAKHGDVHAPAQVTRRSLPLLSPITHPLPAKFRREGRDRRR